jgi:hypothetical protein
MARRGRSGTLPGKRETLGRCICHPGTVQRASAGGKWRAKDQKRVGVDFDRGALSGQIHRGADRSRMTRRNLCAILSARLLPAAGHDANGVDRIKELP